MPWYVIASLINANLIFKEKQCLLHYGIFFLLFTRIQFSADWVIFSHLVFMVYSLSGKSRGLIIRSICLWLQQHTSAKHKFPLFFKKYAYLLLEDNKIWYYSKLQPVANEKMRTKTWHFCLMHLFFWLDLYFTEITQKYSDHSYTVKSSTSVRVLTKVFINKKVKVWCFQ